MTAFLLCELAGLFQLVRCLLERFIDPGTGLVLAALENLLRSFCELLVVLDFAIFSHGYLSSEGLGELSRSSRDLWPWAKQDPCQEEAH